MEWTEARRLVYIGAIAERALKESPSPNVLRQYFFSIHNLTWMSPATLDRNMRQIKADSGLEAE